MRLANVLPREARDRVLHASNGHAELGRQRHHGFPAGVALANQRDGFAGELGCAIRVAPTAAISEEPTVVVMPRAVRPSPLGDTIAHVVIVRSEKEVVRVDARAHVAPVVLQRRGARLFDAENSTESAGVPSPAS